MKFEKFKVKDIITTALIGTVYFIVFALLGALIGFAVQTFALKPFVLLISSGINALVCGTIVVFLANKAGKFGMFIMLALVQVAFNFLMGAATLPWVIGMLSGGLLADLICAKFGYRKRVSLCIAYGTMLAVLNAGVLINTTMMANTFIETWTEQGIDTTQLQGMVDAMQGFGSVIVLVSIFLLGCFGALIGTGILSKHFRTEKETIK